MTVRVLTVTGSSENTYTVMLFDSHRNIRQAGDCPRSTKAADAQASDDREQSLVKKWQDLLKVISVSCVMYIRVLYAALCILYRAYNIQPYTYCTDTAVGLYTFSTRSYVRVAPPRLEKRHHAHLHDAWSDGNATPHDR